MTDLDENIFDPFRSLSKGYSIMETIGEGSGWVWIRKHTRFV